MKPRRFSFLPSVVLLGLSLISGSRALATDIVWGTNLGAGPWVWNTGTNWTGSTAPVTNADRGDLRKDWTAAPTINLNAATTTNGVLWDDTGASGDVAGILGNGGIAANTLTLAGTTPTVDVTGTLTISAAIDGSTGFNKLSAGTLVLTGANPATFTGPITLTAGIIQPGALTGTGTVSTKLGGGLTVKTGTTLDYTLLHASTTQTGTFSDTALITVESGGKIRFRASTGSSVFNIAAPITVSGTTTFDDNGGGYDNDANLTGKLSGSGTITYQASTNSGNQTAAYRTLKLSNATTNYTGNWIVNYTTTSTDDFAELSSGAVGALGTGTVTLNDRAVLTNTIASGLNSITGVTVTKSTATLNLASFPWVNAAASLSLTAGNVELGTGASTVSSLTLGGDSVINAGTGGTLTLTAANLNAGNLTGTGSLVTQGSSTFTNATATAVSTVGTAVNFATATTLSVADFTTTTAADVTFSGALSGSGAITKTGAGNLVISGSGTLGGLFTLSAGTLDFTGSSAVGLTGGLSGSGPIALKGTGIVTLSGASSGYTGTVTVADGAKLSGTATTAGPLLLGNTTGATIYGNNAAPSSAYTATNVTLGGNSEILFATPPAAGTYTILKYTGTLSGSASNLHANYRNSVIHMGSGTNDAITLDVASPVAITWLNGSSDSTWNVATSQNWYQTGALDYTGFYIGDNVVFDDNAVGNQIINITQAVFPSAMSVANSATAYEFSGSPISGATSLSKTGFGSLVLNSANAYTGGTSLGGGYLRVGAAGALGTGTLNFTSGALTAAASTAVTVGNAITYTSTSPMLGDSSVPGALTLSGAQTLTAATNFDVESPVTISGALTGAFQLTKSGPSTLTFTGSPVHGSTVVSAGTLQVGSGSTTGVLPSTASISGGATLRYFRSDTPTIANVFSGAGTLAFKGTGTSAQSSYTLTGANTVSGFVSVETARVQATNTTTDSRFGTAEVQVQSGGQVYATGGTFTNNFTLNGNGWVEGAGSLGALRLDGGSVVSGSVTLGSASRIVSYAGGTGGIISGALIGTAALEINASSSASFTGAVNYTGNGSGFTGLTTVSQGTLNLGGSLGGDVAVSSTTVGSSGW
ncbi:MAG: autotransporter-associated beta strand repeat-containing protein [Luteolibacter sp.]